MTDKISMDRAKPAVPCLKDINTYYRWKVSSGRLRTQYVPAVPKGRKNCGKMTIGVLVGGVSENSQLNGQGSAPADAGLIAVVEDEAIVLVGYQMLFESWGYAVVAAGSADDALRQLTDGGRRPDIIVADYRLKNGCTGIEAVRQIQAAFGSAIPGILVTGDTAADRLREAAASGLPILHKPVNGKQLQQLISQSLANAAQG